LVLFASDRCRFSHDELSAWTALLERIAFTRNTRVIIISSNGDEIAHRLQDLAVDKRVEYVSARVTDVVAFGVETGLTGTPTTAILDSRFRIKLATERVSPTAADEIVRVFARQSGNH